MKVKKRGKKSKKKISKVKKIVKNKPLKKVSRMKKKTIKKKPIKKRIKKISKSRKKKTTKKISKKPIKKGIFKKLLKTIRNVVPTKSSGKIQRAGTGISGFDKMIKGGFERESINLITGGSGSGKTIFSLQFLLEGVRKGENCLYVTFEEKKEEFYANMKESGWDLEKAEKSGKFIFLEYSPEKVKMMLDEGGGAIETVIIKNNIKRMVIDSITSFSLLFPDDLSKRQANLGLFDMIRKWNCTTLFTVQHDPSSGKGKGIPTVEFEVDSITLLYYVNIKNKRERFIEVLKMKGTDHSKEIKSFEIKKGIKIGSRARIKKEELQS